MGLKNTPDSEVMIKMAKGQSQSGIRHTPINVPEIRQITAPVRAFCAIMLYGVAPIKVHLNRKCALALARAAGGRALTDKCGMVRGQIKAQLTEKGFRPTAIGQNNGQRSKSIRQQATGNRQQATGNRQQATGNRQLYTSFN
jgi:hypothetical protein